MEKKFIKFSLLIVLMIVALSSCVNQKKFIYLQNTARTSDTLKSPQLPIAKISPGDILSIYVTSLSTDASALFNPYNAAGSAMSTGGDALSSSTVPGYLVDQEGAIEMPLLGTVNLAGLTTSQAREVIKSRLANKFLKDPTVAVRILNYRVSILGEVSRPSVYVIPNEKVSLMEALSMAGDLTVTGRRDNILIVRDEGGNKIFGHVDLTSRDVYNSPYYYLHANDLIYVEPVKSKTVQGTFAFRLIPFIVGVASAVLLIFVRLK